MSTTREREGALPSGCFETEDTKKKNVFDNLALRRKIREVMRLRYIVVYIHRKACRCTWSSSSNDGACK